MSTDQEQRFKRDRKIMMKETLPALLRNKDITIKELSRLSEVSPSTIYEWKNGRIPANIQNVRAVAEILEVTLYYLLYGTHDPQSSTHEISENIEGTYLITIKKN